jgi:hypothetical protein
MHSCGKPFFSAILASILLGAASASASPTTIDFSTLTGADGSQFLTYSEGGYTVTTASGKMFIAGNFGNPTPDLYTNTGGIEVTSSSGYFTFSSADLANFEDNAGGTYVFSGYLGGALVFSDSGEITGLANVFNAYGAGDDTGTIDSLYITLTSPDKSLQPSPTIENANVDNIVVNSASAPPAVTPEPQSFVLLATGLAATGGAIRRRLRP